MELVEIQHLGQVFPGEYLYHQPSRQMGLCGLLDFDKETIKARLPSGIIVAPMAEFRKVAMSQQEVKQTNAGRCKGCSSR